MILPKEIDPLKAAKTGQTFKGEFAFFEFSRLQNLVHSGSEVYYHWRFYLDPNERACCALQLKCTFILNCQRCAKPVSFELDEEVLMQWVTTEKEAEALPLAIEPLYTDAAGQCRGLEVIEDELILALPMIAMHEEKDCISSKNQAYYLADNEKSHYKPFAKLGEALDVKE